MSRRHKRTDVPHLPEPDAIALRRRGRRFGRPTQGRRSARRRRRTDHRLSDAPSVGRRSADRLAPRALPSREPIIFDGAALVFCRGYTPRSTLRLSPTAGRWGILVNSASDPDCGDFFVPSHDPPRRFFSWPSAPAGLPRVLPPRSVGDSKRNLTTLLANGFNYSASCDRSSSPGSHRKRIARLSLPN